MPNTIPTDKRKQVDWEHEISQEHGRKAVKIEGYRRRNGHLEAKVRVEDWIAPAWFVVPPDVDVNLARLTDSMTSDELRQAVTTWANGAPGVRLQTAMEEAIGDRDVAR